MKKVFATSAAFIFAYAALAFVDGLTIAALWEWFVRPLGAPHLGVANAVGLSVLYQWINRKVMNRDDLLTDEEVSKRNPITPFLQAVIVLGVGFIIHLFV